MPFKLETTEFAIKPVNESILFGSAPGLLAAMGQSGSHNGAIRSSLALKTTRQSIIPMILLEHNARTHQSGLCGREAGRGTMKPPVLLFRRERLPKGTALFYGLGWKRTAS